MVLDWEAVVCRAELDPSQASSFVMMRTWLLSLVCARLLRSWCVLWMAALLASLAHVVCAAHEADSVGKGCPEPFFFPVFSLHENPPFQKCTKYDLVCV